VPWRGDSALTDSIGDFSLVGGWYDGGDNIKNSYTIATTVTFLAWSMVEFSQGYKASGNLAHGLDLIKWGSDYLVKAHTEPTQFIAQVRAGSAAARRGAARRGAARRSALPARRLSPHSLPPSQPPRACLCVRRSAT
jgi:hypothetical protein